LKSALVDGAHAGIAGRLAAPEVELEKGAPTPRREVTKGVPEGFEPAFETLRFGFTKTFPSLCAGDGKLVTTLASSWHCGGHPHG
jgi:hypothetical protein